MLNKSENKKNPFKVPENYFENFNAHIIEQLPAGKTEKVVPMWKKALPWAAVAASVLGVIISVGLFDDKSQSEIVAAGENIPIEATVNGTGLTSVSEDEFYQYIEDQVTAYSLKEMMGSDF